MGLKRSYMPICSFAKLAHSAEAIIIFLSRLLNYIGTGILVAMIFLSVVDVFLRYFVNRPILGGVEMTQYMMVSLSFLGLAWCSVRKAHVKVDLVVSHFAPRVQDIFQAITCFFSLTVFSLITVCGFWEAGKRWQQHDVSDVLGVPSYPFFLVLAIGSAVLCAALVANLFHLVARGMRR